MKRPEFILCALLLVIPGCSRPRAPRPLAAAPLPPGALTHRVAPNDTLGGIAKWYTGSSENWRKLVEVDPSLRPARLRPGQQVAIPKELIVRRDPMPAAPTKSSKARRGATQDVVGKPNETTVAATVSEPSTTPTLQDEVLRDRLQEAVLQGSARSSLPGDESRPHE